MNDELYYAHPVQVRYWNVKHEEYRGGICYHNWLIDAGTGSVNSIDKIVEEVKKATSLATDDIIVELDWLDINQAVLGN